MQKYERSRGHNIRVQSATDGSGEGDITFIGVTTSTVAGKVYVLTGGEGASWVLADNNANSYYEGLLAVAVGNSSAKGMLLRGAITMFNTVQQVGNPVYLHSTAGNITNTRPSATGTVVRILGYGINGDSDTMYFNPDNTYILLS